MIPLEIIKPIRKNKLCFKELESSPKKVLWTKITDFSAEMHCMWFQEHVVSVFCLLCFNSLWKYFSLDTYSESWLKEGHSSETLMQNALCRKLSFKITLKMTKSLCKNHRMLIWKINYCSIWFSLLKKSPISHAM